MYTQAFAASVLLGLAAAAPQWGPPGGFPHPTGHPTYPGWHPTSTHHTSTHHHYPSSSIPVSSSSSSPAGPTGTLVTANFDNLNVPAVSQASPIAKYEDLDYKGFGLTKLVTVGKVLKVASGIIPESAPNVAYYTPNEIAANGNPELTAKFAGSKVEDFDLDGFYFGCANAALNGAKVPKNPVANSSPVNCTVTIQGYDGTNSLVVKDSVNFVVPNHAQSAPMKHVLPTGFKKVTYVTFSTSSTLVKDVATFFDNFEYTIYPTKK